MTNTLAQLNARNVARKWRNEYNNALQAKPRCSYPLQKAASERLRKLMRARRSGNTV